MLNFPRSRLNARKFNVTIEASYTIEEKHSSKTSSEPRRREIYIGGTTTSLIISPNPVIVSGFAVVSAYLGVVLKLSATETGSGTESGTSFLGEIGATLFSAQAITAMILALVFFNVYEFSTLGKRFTMGVSWRSALLIGALCGLASDRILVALKAFLGAS